MATPKLIRRNTYTDDNGVTHTLNWHGATAGHGVRTRELTVTCSCGRFSDVGSEASNRRAFTRHIAAENGEHRVGL